MSEFQTIVTLLIGMAVSVLGWYYARREGLAQAEARLKQTMMEQIAAMESERLIRERVTLQTLQELDTRLKACEERWTRWSRGPIGS